MVSEKLNLYVEDFYDKEVRDKSKKEEKKDLIAFIRDAVELAYNDTKRVCKGIGDFTGTRDTVKEGIVEGIRNYLNDNDCKKDFDSIHRELCMKWTKAFEEVESLADYGKAQKIVNMSFKYLYAYAIKINSTKFFGKFEKCHFTLDSYTLQWLRACKKEEKTAEKIPACLNTGKTWSSLDPQEYKCINDYARKCIEKNFDGYTPLQAEFIIWQGVSLYNALDELEKRASAFPDKDIPGDIHKKLDGIKHGNLLSFIESLK